MTHRSHILLSLATVLVVSAPLTLAEEAATTPSDDTAVTQEMPEKTVSPVQAIVQARIQIESDREVRLKNDRMVQRSLRHGVEYHKMLKRKLAMRGQMTRTVTPAMTTAPAGQSHSAQSWLSGNKNYSPDELMMILVPEHPGRPSWLPHEAKWVPKN